MKTLRTLTAPGWVTKPAADLPENRLTADEVDRNMLAVKEDVDAHSSELQAHNDYSLGARLFLSLVPYEDGWVAADGTEAGQFSLVDSVAAAIRTSGASSVAYSPTGVLLAATGNDSPYLEVYDTSDYSLVSGTPTLPSGAGYAVTFSPDGTMLACSYGAVNGLTVYSTSDWSVLHSSFSTQGNVRDLKFSPDGQYLAVTMSGSPYLYVYDVASWTLVNGTPTLPDRGVYLSWSPDSSSLAVTHYEIPYLSIFNVSDWSTVAVSFTIPEHGGGFAGSAWGVSFSNDGTVLYVIFSTSPYFYAIDTSTWTIIAGTPTIGTIGTNCKLSVSSSDGYVAITQPNDPFMEVVETSGFTLVTHDFALPDVCYNPVFNPAKGELAAFYYGSTTVKGGNIYSVPQQTPDLSGDSPHVDFEWRVKL